MAVIALVLGLTMAQQTVAATITFDSLAAGINADSDPVAMALGITFYNGQHTVWSAYATDQHAGRTPAS